MNLNNFVLNINFTGIHKTDEYATNVNRLQKVPAIVDNQFKLAQSVAIFRYLVDRFPENVAPHWYPPGDAQQRGHIDEYLEWQHLNTRMTCSYYYILKYLKPRTTGREPGDDQIVGSSLRQMEDTLDTIERLWLDDASPFIAGQKEISIADLLCATELEQPRNIFLFFLLYQINIFKFYFIKVSQATNRATDDPNSRRG